jgi:26S proteasome regulatory subunit N9
MKALSVGVIKGRIDQVSQVVVVEWVQPRVLNKSQVQDVLKNVVAWKERVQRAVDDIVSVA